MSIHWKKKVSHKILCIKYVILLFLHNIHSNTTKQLFNRGIIWQIVKRIILFRLDILVLRHLHLTTQIKCFCLHKNVGYYTRRSRDCVLFFYYANESRGFSFYPEKKRLTCAGYNDVFYFIDQFRYRNETVCKFIWVVRINVLNMFIMWWPLMV